MAEAETSPGLLEKSLDAGLRSVAFDPADMGMAPLSLQMLVPGEPCPADLFLALYDRNAKTVKMHYACAKGEEFREKWRNNLIKAEQHRVYVRVDEAPALKDYYDRFAGQLLKDPTATSRKKVQVLQEMASLNLRLCYGSKLDPKATEATVKAAEKIVTWMSRDPQLLQNLSEVLITGYSLYSHSMNVALLSMAFGRFLELSDDRIPLLGMGGLLHDIGMSKVPQEVLLKKGALSPDEMKVVKTHPPAGYHALMNVSAVPYPVLRIVLDHHEKIDGSGYPNHLKGREIPHLARLLAVVDAYDAMTSERPYHEPIKPFIAATALAKYSKGKFSKELAVGFIRFLGSPFMTGKTGKEKTS